MNKHNLKVGQTVWLSGDRNREGLDEMKIKKVGRIWAELELTQDRLNLETLSMESGRRSVWLSKEAYEHSVQLNRAWQDFCNSVTAHRYRKPAHLTLDAIKKAHEALALPNVPN